MDKVIELLKSTNIQISKTLLFNYKKLNITDQEFIVLIYLIIFVTLVRFMISFSLPSFSIFNLPYDCKPIN